MTPVTINLTPEQSAEADTWQDGVEYTFRATQTAPGQFMAIEAMASEPAAPEPEAAAPAAAARGMGSPSSNPAIAALTKGRKAA